MAKNTTRLRMKPQKHVNIPEIGLLTPGDIFDVPDEWTYSDGTVSNPESLVKAGLAEVVEEEPIVSSENTDRVRRRSTASS